MSHYNLALESKLHRNLFQQKKEHCIFISHKREDKKAAIDIGKYLTETVGVHIYLDILDEKLQKATQIENDKLIVESIKEGLECSTHLLCLVSDKTRLSWWVPYEIGIADIKKLNIASLKLNTTDDIPSFLKIQPAFYNVDEFVRYAARCTTYGSLLFESVYPRISANTDILKQYIDY